MRVKTGDQLVVDSTLAGSAIVFRGDMIMGNIFSGHSLPSADSRWTVASF